MKTFLTGLMTRRSISLILLTLLIIACQTTTIANPILVEHEKRPGHLILFATMLTTTAVQCAPSDKSKSIFKPEQIVFTGFIDKDNIFKVYLTADNIWAAMLENTAGLSCIYFTGTPGVLKKPIEKSF
jgi:hypothetical protein